MHPVLNKLFSEHKVSRLQGGDINEVYSIEKDGLKQVIKINSKSDFPDMFSKEAKGLELLSQSFPCPKVISVQEHENWQCLILEYFEESPKKDGFWVDFGNKLAKTHQKSSKNFGFEASNYIGSLVQQNGEHTLWEDFLIQERLAPMIEMAVNSGEVNYVESKIIESFYQRISEIYPTEKPALLHGDLWSGNYLSTSEGPVLIDPAVYYGHREMDLGMMHLFGGFDTELFNVYEDVFPLEKGWKSRIEINQLYPLLVHLNLFGRSYWEQVHTILKPFS